MILVGDAIKLLLELIPLFKSLYYLFKGTPEQNRADLKARIHNAIVFAQDSGGDTSKIEELFKKGK